MQSVSTHFIDPDVRINFWLNATIDKLDRYPGKLVLLSPRRLGCESRRLITNLLYSHVKSTSCVVAELVISKQCPDLMQYDFLVALSVTATGKKILTKWWVIASNFAT